MPSTHFQHLPPCYRDEVEQERVELLNAAECEFYRSINLGDRGGIEAGASRVLGLYSLPCRLEPENAARFLSVLYELSVRDTGDLILSIKCSTVFWAVLRAHSPPTQPECLPGLTLDWRKLAKVFNRIFLLAGTNLALGAQNIAKYASQMVSLARVCRRYWAQGVSEEILA